MRNENVSSYIRGKKYFFMLNIICFHEKHKFILSVALKKMSRCGVLEENKFGLCMSLLKLWCQSSFKPDKRF